MRTARAGSCEGHPCAGVRTHVSDIQLTHPHDASVREGNGAHFTESAPRLQELGTGRDPRKTEVKLLKKKKSSTDKERLN